MLYFLCLAKYETNHTSLFLYLLSPCLFTLTLFSVLLSKKRQQDKECQMFFEYQRRGRKRKYGNMLLADQMIASNATVIATALFCGKKRKKRCPDEARVSNWWEEGLNRWNEEAFKDNFRVNRGTYEFILREIEGYLTKKPTNRNPQPIEPAKQLAICLYRLAHSTYYNGYITFDIL